MASFVVPLATTYVGCLHTIPNKVRATVLDCEYLPDRSLESYRQEFGVCEYLR